MPISGNKSGGKSSRRIFFRGLMSPSVVINLCYNHTESRLSLLLYEDHALKEVLVRCYLYIASLMSNHEHWMIAHIRNQLPKCNLPRRVTTKTPQDKDRQGTNFKYTTIKTLALARPRGSMQQLFYSVFWICTERMFFSFRMTADSILQRACCKIWKTNAVTAGGPLSFRCHQMAYLLGVCLLR